MSELPTIGFQQERELENNTNIILFLNLFSRKVHPEAEKKTGENTAITMKNHPRLFHFRRVHRHDDPTKKPIKGRQAMRTETVAAAAAATAATVAVCGVAAKTIGNQLSEDGRTD
ncbi:unnamed protein product [Nippostrongylus brasiliensis]|uniref:Uncharacterized protein n=1 Tax=Nippostrongylus brasiliensis TaxID=27835 RepID=A0A0N4Y5E9_NIPBR|nr:unnamed protein product [Nippostrongylus brasiliensis]